MDKINFMFYYDTLTKGSRWCFTRYCSYVTTLIEMSIKVDTL